MSKKKMKMRRNPKNTTDTLYERNLCGSKEEGLMKPKDKPLIDKDMLLQSYKLMILEIERRQSFSLLSYNLHKDRNILKDIWNKGKGQER